jgi:hypothetical protein
MKHLLPFLLYSLLFLSIGCEAIGDIFKAGVWVGIIIVLGLVGLIALIVGKAKK